MDKIQGEDAENAAGKDADAAKTMSSAHVCATLPAELWALARHCSFCWAVKWPALGNKGLQPVRPVLVATSACTIPASTALQIIAPL